jgi:serine protease AprX
VIARLDANVSRQQVFATIARLGATIYRELPLIHSLAITLPKGNEVAVLAALKTISGIQHLSPDQTVVKYDEFTVEHTGADTAFAPTWQGGFGLTGKNIGVAVIDSGVRLHLDFLGLPSLYRIVNAPIFATGSQNCSVADPLGHGTHIAGIIAGNGLQSSTPDCFHSFYGIARQATIINVAVLNDQGIGAVSDVIAGINWAVQNRKLYNIRVINLSLGHEVCESYTTDPLNQAVEAAWKAGIVVVCAAGNTGRLSDTPNSSDNEGYGTAYGSIQCPGNDPYVITVGATKNMDGKRADDRITTYSSRGPGRLDMTLKPDIIAPGNQVISTLAPGSTLDTAYGGSNDIPASAYRWTALTPSNSILYFRLSGTSMAAPVVAGAVALMLDKDSTLSPDTIKARLMLSADKWAFPDGTRDVFTFGAGYLNIPATLSSKVTVSNMYAISPSVTANPDWSISIDPQHLLFGTSQSIWNTGVTDYGSVYGTQAIWGGSKVNPSASTWVGVESVQGSQAIWGRGTSSGVDLSTVAIYGE